LELHVVRNATASAPPFAQAGQRFPAIISRALAACRIAVFYSASMRVASHAFACRSSAASSRRNQCFFTST
jgi:hypothetical protein